MKIRLSTRVESSARVFYGWRARTMYLFVLRADGMVIAVSLGGNTCE